MSVINESMNQSKYPMTCPLTESMFATNAFPVHEMPYSMYEDLLAYRQIMVQDLNNFREFTRAKTVNDEVNLVDSLRNSLRTSQKIRLMNDLSEAKLAAA